VTGPISGTLLRQRADCHRTEPRAKPLLQAAALVAKTESEQRALVRGRRCIDLYDEHTFGYYDSRHSHPQAQTTELLKQALAHEGYELVSFALMSALDNLADNPTRIAAVTAY